MTAPHRCRFKLVCHHILESSFPDAYASLDPTSACDLFPMLRRNGVLQMVLLTRNKGPQFFTASLLSSKLFFESIKKHSEIILGIKIHSSTLLQLLSTSRYTTRHSMILTSNNYCQCKVSAPKNLIYLAFTVVLRYRQLKSRPPTGRHMATP